MTLFKKDGHIVNGPNNMRILKIRFFLPCAVLLFAGCNPGADIEDQTQQPTDAVYTEEAAMSYYRTDPERALSLIDSAVMAGNVSWARSRYLVSVTQYGGFHNNLLARQTCLDMINGDCPVDSLTLEQTYLLLAGIEYTIGNHTAIIKYATQASRMAHAMNSFEDVVKAEGLIAQSLDQTGRTDEGIARLEAALNEVLKLNTFNGVVAYHDTSKKLLRILLDHQLYDEMVVASRKVLDRVDELEKHPELFSGIRKNFDTSEFIDFARGQIYAYMAIAYSHNATENADNPAVRRQLLAKAREMDAAVQKTNWSKSVDCDKLMSAAYHHMGEFDRFDKAMRRFEYSYPDTVNPNFMICLEQRSEAADMQGNTSLALDYLRRAHVIKDSLTRRNEREHLSELATVYHLQEEQLIRHQKEIEAQRSHIINKALTVGLIASVFILVWFLIQKSIVERKNRVLAREIAEAAKYRDVYLNSEELRKKTLETQDNVSDADSLDAGLSDSDLYERLSLIIIRDRLYLDPNLDRQALVDRFGLSKDRIGAAFAKGSPFKSLIEFLNDCRLPYAAKLLTEYPDLPIADVARESGFARADTLAANFKQRFTLTPSQYRTQQAYGGGA